MKETELKIDVVSSYGTVTFVSKRYRILILYKDSIDLKNKLETYLRTQVMLASTYPQFIEELEVVDINDGFNKISRELDEVFETQFGDDSRLVATILPILTDYHIELLGAVTKELKWLESETEAGIEASYMEEGCIGEGEFLSINRLFKPANKDFPYCENPLKAENNSNRLTEISKVPILS